jgi:hypothetical protein
MSSVALIASRRVFAPHRRRPDWHADVDPLVCLLVFSATGLLASYFLVLMLACDLSTVPLEVALVGATAPFAARMGLAAGRQP